MSLRSRTLIKASMILTRVDHLFIHNYIRSLLKNILRTIVLVLTGLEPATYRSRVRRLGRPSHAGTYKHITKYTTYLLLTALSASSAS